MDYCSNCFEQKGVIKMPRGDGTGPNGQGARTGRGKGGCKAAGQRFAKKKPEKAAEKKATLKKKD